jgi:hypothetical protein
LLFIFALFPLFPRSIWLFLVRRDIVYSGPIKKSIGCNCTRENTGRWRCCFAVPPWGPLRFTATALNTTKALPITATCHYNSLLTTATAIMEWSYPLPTACPNCHGHRSGNFVFRRSNRVDLSIPDIFPPGVPSSLSDRRERESEHRSTSSRNKRVTAVTRGARVLRDSV